MLQKNHPDFKDPLFCCYVRNQDAFPEQDSFIADCQCYYNLEIMTVQNDIKAGLETILKRKPHLKACLMGTRRTDPHSSNLQSFQVIFVTYKTSFASNTFLDDRSRLATDTSSVSSARLALYLYLGLFAVFQCALLQSVR